MKTAIELSIQEIVVDFENLVRYDERLDMLFDHKEADEAEIRKFYTFIMEMTIKYIPSYLKHVDDEFEIGNVSYDNALILYRMIYENFKEIFQGLV